MAKRKSISQDFVDIAVATPLAGVASQIVGDSGLPLPITRGTQSLIGVKLIQGASDKLAKKRKEFF